MTGAASGVSQVDRISVPLRVLAFSLIGVGILLRVLLATHRMPINVDEANVVERALRLFVEGPNPRWFKYPSLYLYAVALSEGVLFSVRWMLDLSSTPAAFADWYFADPRAVYMTARIWSLAAGVVTLGLVYQLGVQLASPQAGLWAAAFLAVSPLHIYYSAIAKPDAAMVLAMLAAGALSVRYVQERRAGLPWGAAVLSGLAATLKYPGGAAWFAAPAAMVFSPEGSLRAVWVRVGQVVLLGAIAAVVFVAGSPFTVLEPALVRRDVGGHVHLAREGWPGMEGVTTWSLYLGSALPYALSFPILGLAFWGLVVLLRRDWRCTVVALVPVAAYAIPTFAASFAQFGYVMPLLPMLCLCAGEGFGACRFALTRGGGHRATFLGGLIMLACVAFPLEAAVCAQVRALRATSQELTAQWIREHLPPGARIFGTAAGLTWILPLTPERLDELLAEAMRERVTGGARVRFVARTATPGAGYYFYDMEGYQAGSSIGEIQLLEYDHDWITKEGFQYVVDSEVKMRRFFGAPERYPLPFRFQQWLAVHGELVYTTHPGSRGWTDWRDDPERVRALEPSCGFVGGELRIYRIKGGTP